MNVNTFDYRSKIAYDNQKACKTTLNEMESARTSLWCLKPGQSIQPHVHAGDHVWIVLEGEGLFLSNEQEGIPVRQGNVLTTAAGVMHGITNNSKSGLVFISITTG